MPRPTITVHQHQHFSKDNNFMHASSKTISKNKHKNSCCFEKSKAEKSRTKKISRVLVLQGGGALGAYEVGALRYLSEALQKKDKKRNNVNRPLLDVVVGSSMGAVNAAILVHNVISPKTQNQDQHKIWDQAIERLHDFYMEISEPVAYHPLWWINKFCFENSLFEKFWTMSSLAKKMFSVISLMQHELFFNNKNNMDSFEKIRKNSDENFLLFLLLQYTSFLKHEKYDTSPTAENARRYYYYLTSILYGIPKVLSPAIIQPDLLYWDPLWSSHVYTRFSNEPLVKTMKKFWDYSKFPISTAKNQPRLLLVTVDIEDSSTPVIVDSHYKKDDNKKNTHYSEYGSSMQYRLEYQSGITEDHVRASMSTPLRHKYPSFSVYNKKTKQHEVRHFWDGAFISNSPVQEVINAHTNYWQQQEFCDPPDLELYMINLYPTVKKGIPDEQYSIQDRETDMKFQSKAISDDMINEINFRSAAQDIINDVTKFQSKNHSETCLLSDYTMKSKFPKIINDNKGYRTPTLCKVVKIERHESVENSVFGKAFDFSRKTITQLIDDGYNDAKQIINDKK